MAGNRASYAGRGLIPRCIAALLSRLGSTPGLASWSVAVSYLEIYNESLYDLLDLTAQPHELSLYEDGRGRVQVGGGALPGRATVGAVVVQGGGCVAAECSTTLVDATVQRWCMSHVKMAKGVCRWAGMRCQSWWAARAVGSGCVAGAVCRWAGLQCQGWGTEAAVVAQRWRLRSTCMPNKACKRNCAAVVYVPQHHTAAPGGMLRRCQDCARLLSQQRLRRWPCSLRYGVGPTTACHM
jgi:hypothetical protein